MQMLRLTIPSELPATGFDASGKLNAFGTSLSCDSKTNAWAFRWIWTWRGVHGNVKTPINTGATLRPSDDRAEYCGCPPQSLGAIAAGPLPDGADKDCAKWRARR